METSISGNLEMLAEEKALIASGHHLVADLIEGITKKMGTGGVTNPRSHVALCCIAFLEM